MNISVQNLDGAYEQCKELHTLVTNTGANLINALENNVGSLKINWKGSDATIHINNLIKVHDALVALVTDAKALTSDAADKVRAIQEVRKSNGGSPVVGEELSKNAPASQALPLVEDTGEFFVKPEAAGLAADLADICTKYETFISEFEGKKDTLFSNWTAGANIERAKENFEEFLTYSDQYKTYLVGAKTNLETAVANMQKL